MRTHKEIIDIGCVWLQKKFHCNVILKEFKAWTVSGEIPDIIGWSYGGSFNNPSFLIEVKATRADFLRDKRKKHRIQHMGIGNWRIYLTNPDVIKSESEIPENWCVYEVHEHKIMHKYGLRCCSAIRPPFSSCIDSEKSLLLAAFRGIENQWENSKKVVIDNFIIGENDNEQ